MLVYQEVGTIGLNSGKLFFVQRLLDILRSLLLLVFTRVCITADGERSARGIRNDKKSPGRNKVERNGINSEHKVPLRPHRVEGRGDAIVIDVDRSFDLSAAIRARASRCVPTSRPGNLHIPINYVLVHTQIAGNLLRVCTNKLYIHIYKYIKRARVCTTRDLFPGHAIRQVDAEDIGRSIVPMVLSRYLDPLASISIDLWIIVIGPRDSVGPTPIYSDTYVDSGARTIFRFADDRAQSAGRRSPAVK